jgi:predicted small lipoprotein YifL
MKKLLKVTMIVSFVIALSACGRMGDLTPATANQVSSATTFSAA